MATITTINATDLITNSRSDINTNFANLNSDKIETSYLDTDTSLAANSDSKIATQKAVKSYIDTQGGANASETVRGVVEEATDAEVTAGTATGGTGAKLIVTPAKLSTRLTTLFNVSLTSVAETVLGADATSITASSIPSRDKLWIVLDCPGLDGDPTDVLFRVNADTAGNYGYNVSTNTGAPATANGATSVFIDTSTGVGSRFAIFEMNNIATKVKSIFYRYVVTADNSNAPSNAIGSAVWANTSNQVTSVTFLLSSNKFLAGTTLTVYAAN